MPKDGDAGIANDGTPVIWSDAAGAAVPASQYVAVKKATAAPPIEKAAAARLTLMQAGSKAAQDMAGATNDFAIKNDETPTGFITGLPGMSKLAQALNLKGSQNLGQMEADSLQAASAKARAITTRPSQMEFLKMLGGVPNVGKALPSNRTMQEQNNKVALLANAQRAFYERYITRMGNDKGADDAWNSFFHQHWDPAGNFSETPMSPKDRVNAALKAKSGKVGEPIPDGSMIDINGRVISQ